MENFTSKYIIQIVADVKDAKIATSELARIEEAARQAGINVSQGFETISTSMKPFVVDTKAGAQEFVKYSAVIKDSQGTIKNVSAVFKKTGDELSYVANSARVTDTTMKTATKSVGDLAAQMGKLAIRAALVAPLWMAVRGAIQGVLGTIQDIIQAYRELDEGMRRVMAVATYTTETQARTYAELEHSAKVYFASSAVGFKEITEAMYQLGTAGRSTEEMLSGFNHILDLAAGTFGNVATAGKTVSGILNVFEKQLKAVGTTSDQIQYVADLLAVAWKNNQIELSELATAMSYLGSVGGALEMDLKELIASASVMSDALNRGGKGGRLLARSFTEIIHDSRKLRQLGVLFDPSQPLNYYDVMKQIHDLYVKQEGSMSFVNELISIFGQQGSRAVLNVVQQWEKFNKELARTPEEIKGIAKQLKELSEGSWWKIISILWKQTWMGIPKEGTGKGPKDFFIGLAASGNETIETVKKLQDAVEFLGDSLTEEERRVVSKVKGRNIFSGYLKGIVPFGTENLMNIANTTRALEENREVIDELIDRYDALRITEEAYANIRKKAGEKEAPYVEPTTKQKTQNFLKFLDKWIASGKEISDMNDGQIMFLATFIGRQKESLEINRAAFEEMAKGAKIQKSSVDALLLADKIKVKQIEDESKYNKLRFEGLSESAVIMEKINDFVNDYNTVVLASAKSEEEKQKFLITTQDILSDTSDELYRHLMLTEDIEAATKLKTAAIEAFQKEYADLTSKEKESLEINYKLNLMQADGLLTTRERILAEMEVVKASEYEYQGRAKNLKLLDLESQYLVELKKEVSEYATTIRDDLGNAFADVFKAESSVKDAFEKFSESVMGIYAETAGNAIATAFIKSSGLGENFGQNLVGLFGAITGTGKKGLAGQIEGAFDYGMKVPEAIKGAFDYGYSQFSQASNMMMYGYGGGGVGGKGLVYPSEAPAQIPWWRKVPGAMTPMMRWQGGQFGWTNVQGQWQKAGLWNTAGALGSVGMGAYNLSQLYKLKGTGMVYGGAFQGLTAGAQVGSMFGPIGTIIGGLGGMIYGAIRGGQSKTVAQWDEYTKKVTSRIHVTNKELEIVNRNLVALRAVMETYILPESAYFAEKRNIEDQFSLHSRRGLTG